MDARVAAIAWSMAEDELSLLPGVRGEWISGVGILGAAGRAAGRMLARAACGTMPTRLDEVMAATALAAAAALGK